MRLVPVEGLDDAVHQHGLEDQAQQGAEAGGDVEDTRAEAAMSTSEQRRAMPTSRPVNFLRIMAAMSVPPLERRC